VIEIKNLVKTFRETKARGGFSVRRALAAGEKGKGS
jgi:hypothetical protein